MVSSAFAAHSAEPLDDAEKAIPSGSVDVFSILPKKASKADKIALSVAGSRQLSVQNAPNISKLNVAAQEAMLRAGMLDDVETAGSTAKPKGMFVTFKDVTYTVWVKRDGFFKPKTPLVLLNNLCGFFRPGRMSALMGPSGSGKTTLLDVLAGRKTAGKVEGNIQYGYSVASTNFLRRHTGYVEQFDTLVDNLSVFEMLLYTAEMKLPHTLSKAEKVIRVERAIAKLELHSCRNVRIGNATRRGISGGQAKRVNIGVSMVTEPLVLYLDEPTSGLDSFTADECMSVVRQLSLDGICVCATIHSPSPTTFALFDRLLLLVGGRAVYFGDNGDTVLDYFRNSKLSQDMGPVLDGRAAEWVVQLITHAGNRGQRDDFADPYAASGLWAAELADEEAMEAAFHEARDLGLSTITVEELDREDPRHGRATAVPTAFALRKIFQYRTLRSFQDPMFLSARLVDKVLSVSIIMSLFRAYGTSTTAQGQQALAAAFFMWTAQPAFGAAAYLPTIMLERPLYQREHSDGLYYSWVYYVSKWFQELVLAIPASIFFSALVWGALELQNNFGIFWIAYLSSLLCSIAAECPYIGFAFCFAAICPTIDFANGAVPSYGSMLLFFVGYLVPLQEIPGWWIWYSYIDYLRYPFVAMMLNQFSGSEVVFNPNNAGEGSTILDFYGMANEHIWFNMIMGAAWFVAFVVLGALLMKYINWSSR